MKKDTGIMKGSEYLQEGKKHVSGGDEDILGLEHL